MKKILFLIPLFLTNPAFGLQNEALMEQSIEKVYNEFVYDFKTPYVKQNPYGRNALSALIKFETEKEAKIKITILPKGDEEPLTHLFDTFNTEHSIPVLGLYPNHENKVELTAIYKDGSNEKTTVTIKTDKVDKRALFVIEDKKDNRTHYHYLHNGIVFDEHKNIRLSLNAEYEMVYFLNGEFIAEDRNLGLIRYNSLGKKMMVYTYPKGFSSFTHGIQQKPNKNFLVIGSFNDKKAIFEGKEAQTQREFIIEIDYNTGEVLNTIDLANILNPDRSVVIKSSTANYGLNNWCHINGIDYDAEDESLLVSCRHVGMIKVDEKTKALKFLISSHQGHDKSGRTGDGPALTDKLLTATDAKGAKLDTAIQMGFQNHPDFKWPYKNHDARVVKHNIYSVFDNSGNVFDTKTASTPYSNAIVYQVNEKENTIQTLWYQPLFYHTESGGSVIYDYPTGSVSVYLSIVKDKGQKGIGYGKLLRFDTKTKEKLFEATIYRGGETYFYGIQKFSFYK